MSAFDKMMNRAMLGTNYCAENGVQPHKFKPTHAWEPHCYKCGQIEKHIVHDPSQRKGSR